MPFHALSAPVSYSVKASSQFSRYCHGAVTRRFPDAGSVGSGRDRPSGRSFESSWVPNYENLVRPIRPARNKRNPTCHCYPWQRPLREKRHSNSTLTMQPSVAIDATVILLSEPGSYLQRQETFQDRLTGELRLAGATDLAAANDETRKRFGARLPKISAASAASSTSASSAMTTSCSGRAAVSKSQPNQNASASLVPGSSFANPFKAASKFTTERVSFSMPITR